MIWQKGILLVKVVYNNVEVFPKDEVFGLTSQIKRSAGSIPSNITEGWGRGSTLSYIHFFENC
ncbi:four helix bundle protein [Flavobacterium frigidarium]|uniref:four helix bundle protein n=1 Tax=Flavobacterium frigidarium TaxID=99286 RepID=UPI0030D967A7